MNTNTYVDRPNDKGTALDRERQLATLLEDDDVLCAHVYDDSGYSEFLFHGSPENIANFIGARPMVHQIVLTDRQERPVCSYCVGERRVGGAFQQGVVGKIAFGKEAPVWSA